LESAGSPAATPGASPAHLAFVTRAAREFELPLDAVRQAATMARRIRTGEGRWAWDSTVIDWQGNEVTLLHAGVTQRIDRLVRRRDTGEWWVLDYKSAPRPEEQPELVAQMNRYRDAMRNANPGATVRVAFLTGEGRVVEVVAVHLRRAVPPGAAASRAGAVGAAVGPFPGVGAHFEQAVDAGFGAAGGRMATATGGDGGVGVGGGRGRRAAVAQAVGALGGAAGGVRVGLAGAEASRWLRAPLGVGGFHPFGIRGQALARPLAIGAGFREGDVNGGLVVAGLQAEGGAPGPAFALDPASLISAAATRLFSRCDGAGGLRKAGELRDADLFAVDRETSDGLHVINLRLRPRREREPDQQGDERVAHGRILVNTR
jgi:hypothetical protein